MNKFICLLFASLLFTSFVFTSCQSVKNIPLNIEPTILEINDDLATVKTDIINIKQKVPENLKPELKNIEQKITVIQNKNINLIEQTKQINKIKQIEQNKKVKEIKKSYFKFGFCAFGLLILIIGLIKQPIKATISKFF